MGNQIKKVCCEGTPQTDKLKDQYLILWDDIQKLTDTMIIQKEIRQRAQISHLNPEQAENYLDPIIHLRKLTQEIQSISMQYEKLQNIQNDQEKKKVVQKLKASRQSIKKQFDSIRQQKNSYVTRNSEIVVKLGQKQIVLPDIRKQLLSEIISKTNKAKMQYDLQQLTISCPTANLQTNINMNCSSDHKKTLLFMIEQDVNSINRLRINYHCQIVQRISNKAKLDFIQLLKRIYPQQRQNIGQFYSKCIQNIENSQDNKNLFFNQVFKQNFLWNCLQNVPKITTDPTILAYIRWGVKYLYDTIYNGYRTIKNRPLQLYIVVELNPKQKQKFKEQSLKAEQNKYNYLIFTTFLKGYTRQSDAYKHFNALKNQNKNIFLLNITQCRYHESPYDYGYIVSKNIENSQPDVIFNILNVFKIKQISIEARRGVIQYGHLGIYHKNRIDPARRKTYTEYDQNLLRNLDYCNFLTRKIKNQANALQISGYIQNLPILYFQKQRQIKQAIKQSKIPVLKDEEELDLITLDKADALVINKKYQSAQKTYQELKTQKYKLIASIRLIELYYLMDKDSKNSTRTNQLIENISQNVDDFLKYELKEEYLKAKNYYGLSLILKSQFRTANKYYKDLRLQIIKLYPGQYEGIPFVHQIYRNLALTELKTNRDQAEKVLKTVKSWHKFCEGRGPSSLITQSMIQDIERQKQNNDGVEESKRESERIRTSMATIGYIDSSRGFVEREKKIISNLLNSSINIDIGKTSDY